jgi:hypothetical protein
MLTYLNALCVALLARDSEATRRLLEHPLAGALPASVRHEAAQVVAGTTPVNGIPLDALKLYHQTAHCLGVAREQKPRPVEAKGRRDRTTQMELPLPSTGRQPRSRAVVAR